MDEIPNRTVRTTGAWRGLPRNLGGEVDHRRVFTKVCDEGLTTPRFVAMSLLSAAIAILGLMLSSPAVVIGAMLLSPLMGPIMLLGFSFWTVEWSGVRRALLSLTVGLGLALAVAVVLTWLSPLKEPTSEILARTRPNLFDLLIAGFSGIAGGYAVIRERGETVIGVAIATALMPPIATVGFGLGTQNWPVTLGALLLFATNLIAIALAAAGMAALYGFNPHYKRAGAGLIGNLAVLATVAALCVPLTLSLNTIAIEGRATTDARREIHRLFGDKARISSLQVRRTKHAIEVDGLVATPAYVGDAGQTISHDLGRHFGLTAHVNLDQVVLADPQKIAAPAAAQDPTSAAVEALRDAVPFPTQTVAYDPKASRGVVVLGGSSGLDLSAAMALETGLRARQELANTEVIPPLQALPAITIASDTAVKSGADAFGPNLKVAVWALQRWRANAVQADICGVRSGGRWKRLRTALQTALAPLPVTTVRRGGCSPAHAAGPVVMLAPG